MVWNWAGIYFVGSRPTSFWLAQKWIPRTPRTLLLWCRSQQGEVDQKVQTMLLIAIHCLWIGLWARHCWVSLQILPLFRYQHFRNECWSYASPGRKLKHLILSSILIFKLFASGSSKLAHVRESLWGMTCGWPGSWSTVLLKSLELLFQWTPNLCRSI